MEDDVLVKGVTEKAYDYYKWFGADVKYERMADLAHVMPTDLPFDPVKHINVAARKLQNRSHVKFPFISNCGVDMAGNVLNHLLPKLTNAPLKERAFDWQTKGKLLEFD